MTGLARNLAGVAALLADAVRAPWLALLGRVLDGPPPVQPKGRGRGRHTSTDS